MHNTLLSTHLKGKKYYPLNKIVLFSPEFVTIWSLERHFKMHLLALQILKI